MLEYTNYSFYFNFGILDISLTTYIYTSLYLININKA